MERNRVRSFENNSNLFAILQNDSVIAYYCIENAPSKHDEFEFLVVYDIALNIKKVQVLVYRKIMVLRLKVNAGYNSLLIER